MPSIIGISLKKSGKIYYFNPEDTVYSAGDGVLVEMPQGIQYGEVVFPNREMDNEDLFRHLKTGVRKATDGDRKKLEDIKEREKKAFEVCEEKIRKHGLDMKLINVEYAFDLSKVVFFFTADGRVDFRELVKDLASVFRTRIELRQIGVRDETKIRGGIGICGRPLCCHAHLSDFIPVSIKMAKEQNLSLNPANVSGVCGRLMCCLKNEEETYEELNKTMPGVGDTVKTNDGFNGEVVSINVLRQKVRVVIEIKDEKEIREYNASELYFKKNSKKEREVLSEEDRKALELLEKQEREDILETEREAEEERKEIIGDNASGSERKHYDRKKDGSKSFDNQGKKKEKKEWKDGKPDKNKSDKKKGGNNPQQKNGGHYHNNRRESRPRHNGEE
jgi:cell fate regulator YaaT (PSP1 superfamily)